MPNDPDLFDEPPSDGGVYLKRKDGRYQRLEAATKPAPIGATHTQRRAGTAPAAPDAPTAAPAPVPVAAPDPRGGQATHEAASAWAPDTFTDTSDSDSEG